MSASSRSFRVRGRLRESDLVDTPPHPDPLPASGEREKKRRANVFPGATVTASLPVAQAVHQRFFLTAVDLDHGAVDHVHQR
jgi:hypothetical protein